MLQPPEVPPLLSDAVIATEDERSNCAAKSTRSESDERFLRAIAVPMISSRPAFYAYPQPSQSGPGKLG